MITYYLYVKTHKVTGLKYLGQTSRDPYDYKGSGTYWLRHLKKHGYCIDTKILIETRSKVLLSFWGLYFSLEWDIIDSEVWANLKFEIGDGGSFKGINKGKIPWNKGIPRSEETKRKISITKNLKGSTYEEIFGTEKAAELKDQFSKDRQGPNNSFYGKQHSLESKNKMSELARNRPPMSEETREKLSKLAKGKKKSLETRKKMTLANLRKYRPMLSCPHCGKSSRANIKRYHFNNCKTIGNKIEF